MSINNKINNESEKKNKKALKNLKKVSIFFSSVLLIFLICVLCEVVPRYIRLPVNSPGSQNEVITWDTTEYSILVIPVFPLIERRMFITRKEYFYNDANDTWDDIANYFDDELVKLGWKRINSFAPCIKYFPEEKFLPHNNVNEEGYISYRPQNYDPINDYNAGDSACIAIWKETESTTNSYHIVIYTARASILSWFFLTN